MEIVNDHHTSTSIYVTHIVQFKWVSAEVKEL